MTIYKIGELLEIERVQTKDDGWQDAVRALIGVQGRVLGAVCFNENGKAVTRYRLDGVGMWIRHECMLSHGAPTDDELASAVRSAVEQQLFESASEVLAAWDVTENKARNNGYYIKPRPIKDDEDEDEDDIDPEDDDDDEFSF